MNTKYIAFWCRMLLATLLITGFSACGGSGNSAGDSGTTFHSITVFGDSLSDVGTYQVATGNPANPGKFTINAGNIWVDNIAAHFGLTLSPNRSLTLDKDASGGATTAIGTATVLGGNGYAEGGARVSQLPSESGVGNNQLVAPVSQQVTHYLAAHGTFPASELVVIDGGGNDTYAQFDAICFGGDDNGIGAGNTTTAIATAAVAQAANDLVTQVKRIKSNGANVVLVAGAVDWSTNPFARQYLASAYQAKGCYAPVPAAQITEWTAQFNAIVSQGVTGIPGVVYVDLSSTLSAVVANPSAFGFTNVTDQACNNTLPTTSAVFCTTGTIVDPNAAQTYLFSDSFHPTPHGHQILSDAALAALSAAVKLSN